MCGIIGIAAEGRANQLLYDGLLLLQHRGQDAAGIVTAEGPKFHMHKGPGYVRDVFRTRDMRALAGRLGIVARSPVNQVLYDGLLLLQHRGQDAAGIVTAERKTFHMQKGNGQVRDVFRTRNMRSLPGNIGIAHCRYPTAGSAFNSAEAQPFYVNSPFGIVLGHNGNLTNADALKEEMFRQDLRHINTNSDSEVLLNVLAHELENTSVKLRLDPQTIFRAVANVHRRCRGAYAVIAMVAGYGVLAFRDPYGIRPAVIGYRESAQGTDYMVASESVAVDALGFRLLRDVAPGEAVLIDEEGNFHSQQCAPATSLNPCIFEYVYLARPDSVIDGASVYEARLVMGEKLAGKIRRSYRHLDIDVVIPIPDSSRPSALQLAQGLGLPYREGFVKNRYIGRTFIMPGQAVRTRSVRQKLNPMAMEFSGKNVLLVDDSIVRGTTSREIVQMARESGARKVFFASAAPPVRFPNVYGIDMPTRSELIAAHRSEEEVGREIGADALIYQDLDALIEAVRAVNPKLTSFEASCFDGRYVTGDVTADYLHVVETRRDALRDSDEDEGAQLDLNLVANG
jgi:amidophosphoribosyltransferase